MYNTKNFDVVLNDEICTFCVRIYHLFQSKEYLKLQKLVDYLIHKNKNETNVEILFQNSKDIFSFLQSPEIFGCSSSNRIFENYFILDTTFLFYLSSKSITESMINGNRDDVEELLYILEFISKFYPNIKSHIHCDIKTIEEISKWASNQQGETNWIEVLKYLDSLKSVDSKHIFIEHFIFKLIEQIEYFLDE